MRSLILKLHIHPSALWVIFEINFFRNLATAVLSAVLAIYFRKFVNSDAAVAVIFFIGYLAAFFSNLYSGHIIEHLKKRKTLVLTFTFFTVAFGLFAYVKHTAAVLFLFALYQFILALFITDIGLYIKHYSNYRTLAENEGKLGSFGNIGWLIGPILGSMFAETYGFETVFLFASAVSLIALFTFFFIRIQDEEIHYPHEKPMLQNLKIFFLNPNFRKTYINNAGYGFIYSIWDYIPLLLLGIGAGLPLIGLTRTLMGVALTIFEYPVGKLSKKFGERKFCIAGFALTAIGTLLLGVVSNIPLFVATFFIASVGLAFIEMTRDAYFYRQVTEKDIEIAGVYRTADGISFPIGQGMAIICLSLLPLNWWFIIGGGLGLLFAVNALRLKELSIDS